jgi:hypothetical protein
MEPNSNLILQWPHARTAKGRYTPYMHPLEEKEELFTSILRIHLGILQHPNIGVEVET